MSKQSPAKSAKSAYVSIKFQSGPINRVGINGCRIEDVVEILKEKLTQFQAGELSCIENEEAIHHLELANAALKRRRLLREAQGVFDTQLPHRSLLDDRTEDHVSDFSATGS